MSHDHSNPDGSTQYQPCQADCAAIDALIEAQWNVKDVPGPMRERAARAFALIHAASHAPTDDQAAARLVDKICDAMERASTPTNYLLTPDDEEAIDAWQLAEHRTTKVPGSLRDRAAKLDAIGALLTSPPAIAGPARSTDQLIDATMARLQHAQQAGKPRRIEPARIRKFPIGDLVSIAAMLLLGVAVIWPIAASGRSHMQQLACRSNLASVASGLGLYSGDNTGQLPMATASLAGSPWWDVGVPERSNSANLFTLARTEYTTPKALECGGNPNCDSCKLTCDDRDWKNIDQVSYSFRVMFGGKNPTWQSPADVVVLSDKSPVVSRAVRGQVVFPAENSPNHDGRGQNVLTLDGSAKFMTTPVTASGDNMWLPRGIEIALAQLAKSLKPGQSGTIEIKGWVSPNRMEPIKGIETPADERDSFVGP
jgi:hypothetical protein